MLRDQIAADGHPFSVIDGAMPPEVRRREAEPTALRILKDLLPRTPEAPVDFKAPAAPNGWHIATISQRLNKIDEFRSWNHNHAVAGHAGKPWFLDAVDGHSRLDRMEQALRSSLNDGIERHLKGKRPLAQQRRPRR